MATRHARFADKASNEKHAKILKALLQKNPNKYCADCKKKDARWASWNLGIFICIRCSGIHRSLGVHISKVKSVDLDTWVPDQVENMVRWGNERANKYWEANLKDRKPNESNMEMWIRAKYEQKRWAMKGPIPDPSTLGGDEQESQAAPAPQPEKVVEKPKPKQSEFANLDAIFNSPSTTTTNSNTSNTLQGADFFFDTTTTTTTTTTTSSTTTNSNQLQGADFFFDATPKQNNAKPQQQNFDVLKASILSLYDKPTSQPQPQQSDLNGNFYNQFSSMGLGSNQQTSSNNVWGSFETSSQQSDNNNNNNNDVWGSFATATPIQSQQPTNNVWTSSVNTTHQSDQFFSEKPTTATKQPEKKDAFADLFSF